MPTWISKAPRGQAAPIFAGTGTALAELGERPDNRAADRLGIRAPVIAPGLQHRQQRLDPRFPLPASSFASASASSAGASRESSIRAPRPSASKLSVILSSRSRASLSLPSVCSLRRACWILSSTCSGTRRRRKPLPGRAAERRGTPTPPGRRETPSRPGSKRSGSASRGLDCGRCRPWPGRPFPGGLRPPSEHRSERATGPAPLGPEVDDHREPLDAPMTSVSKLCSVTSMAMNEARERRSPPPGRRKPGRKGRAFSEGERSW